MGFIEYLVEKKQDIPKPYKIYVDMDGVLCNFEKAWANLGKEHTEGMLPWKYEEKYGQEKFHSIIKDIGKTDFWANMDWQPGGKELWNYIKKYNPTILSTPTRSKSSKDGKTIWLDRELGKDIPRIFEKDKYKYSEPETILIDDYEKKISDWIEKGDGIGVWHQNTDDTIKRLKEYGI
jgi:hypothetical protein